MSEFDWNDLGNSIRDLVQDAIETRDFDKLNSNISRTIEQAMDGVGETGWAGRKSSGPRFLQMFPEGGWGEFS